MTLSRALKVGTQILNIEKVENTLQTIASEIEDVCKDVFAQYRIDMKKVINYIFKIRTINVHLFTFRFYFMYARVKINVRFAAAYFPSSLT